MIDESIDIAVVKELVVYARFLLPDATVSTAFLRISELPNGTAEAVEGVLVSYLEDKSLSIERMVGFGSDGASVMTGQRTGVATRLKHRQPKLVTIHCVAPLGTSCC